MRGVCSSGIKSSRPSAVPAQVQPRVSVHRAVYVFPLKKAVSVPLLNFFFTSAGIDELCSEIRVRVPSFSVDKR